MGQISFDNPVPGQSDSTEEPKIVTALTTLRDLVNGRLDKDNLSASAGILDTQLGGAPLSSTWRTIAVASRTIVTSDGAGPLIVPSTGNSSVQLFTLDPMTSVVPTGRTPMYRMHVVGGTGTTPPPASNTLTCGIYNATVRTDGQMGSLGSATAVTVSTAIPDVLFSRFGSAVALANGVYAIGITLTGALSAGAMYVCAYVEGRYV